MGHWAAPDNEPTAFYIDEISGTHFWTVDGTWEDEIEGTNALVLDARFSYVGNNEEGLDFDLYNGDEEDAFLAWRPNSSSTWIQYPDYTWQSGSLINGNGVFKVSTLRKGQYAFANGDISLSEEYLTFENTPALAYPSPARTSITLDFRNSTTQNSSKNQVVKIWDVTGRFVYTKTINDFTPFNLSLEGWSEGVYVAVLFDRDGFVNSTRFVVDK
jgi:hypothetical protein